MDIDARHYSKPSLVALGLLLALGGCSGIEAPEPMASAGLSCVDDSLECITKRQSLLKTMVSDKDRKWVRDTPTPEAYASGVRLFAFKSKKKELSCDELSIGRREADGASASLRGPGANRLTPQQISRGAMLAQEVSRELGNEMSRRCKKA